MILFIYYVIGVTFGTIAVRSVRTPGKLDYFMIFGVCWLIWPLIVFIGAATYLLRLTEEWTKNG